MTFATTAKSWYLAIETRRLVALAEQDVQLYTGLLKLAKIREAAGKVANLDVVEASASLNEAQSQLQKMQGLYSEARRNLEVLIGRYPRGDVDVDSGFVPTPPPIQAGLPGSLLERRPDLLAAERQVLAAFRTLEASKLALLPSITLTGDGGRLDDRVLSLLNLNPTLFHSAPNLRPNLPRWCFARPNQDLLSSTRTSSGRLWERGIERLPRSRDYADQ